MTTSSKSSKFFTLIALISAGLTVPALANLGTETWTGGGASSDWSDPGNWTGTNVLPQSNDFVHFAGTTRTTNVNDLGQNTSLAQLLFDANAASFHLEGNSIGFFNNNVAPNLIQNNSANAQRIDFGNSGGFTGNAAITVGGVPLTINAAAGDINLTIINVELENFGAGADLTFDGAHDITLTAGGRGIYDPFLDANVIKNGSGTLTFFDDNNYHGSTTINAGTLIIGSSVSLGFGDVNLNGGTLRTIEGVPLTYFVGDLVGANFNANGGQLYMQVGGTNSGVNSDFMGVFGNANLDPANSHLFVHRINNYNPNNGDTVNIIATLGAVNGQFSDAPPNAPAPNDFLGLIQPFAVYGS